jgi:ferrous iron transport protein A
MTNENPRRSVLSEIATGARVVFRGVEGARALSNRLAALGLVAGTQLEVLQNSRHGPVLVRVHNTRVALGRNEAQEVIVEEIAQ